MSHTIIPLREVDTVSVKILMDNTFDMLMTSSAVAKWAQLRPNPFDRLLPMVEHGFSVLITIKQGIRLGQSYLIQDLIGRIC